MDSLHVKVIMKWTTADPTISEFTRESCFVHLGRASIGRIGITMGALPVILPVRFGRLDGAVVFWAMHDTKLHAASDGAVVAFQVDAYEPSAGRGWSVLVQGMASAIPDNQQARALEDSGLPEVRPNGITSGGRDVIRINGTMVSGRNLQAEGEPSAHSQHPVGGGTVVR